MISLTALVCVAPAGAAPRVPFQSNAVPQERVLDQNGAVVPRARISAKNIATGSVTPPQNGFLSPPTRGGGSLINALIVVARFGSLGRNVISALGVRNIDFSALKNIELSEKMRLQFRTEVFDLLNHASFGQRGRVVGSATVAQIINTRFPTGDSGSSRQLQFVLKLMF